MLTNKITRAVEMKSPAAGAQREATHCVANPNAVRLNLSGSVFVDYEVTIVDESGWESYLEMRVQFPDEVRSLLETMSWPGGARMTEKLNEIGTSYLLGLFADGNFGRPRRLEAEVFPRVAASNLMTVHPSIEFVRASLVTHPTPV